MKLPLERGEYPLGRYKTRFAHFTLQGWEARGPWMRAIVTNQRLVFMPDDPTNPQAAASPAAMKHNDIVRAWNVCLGRRDGAIIALKSGKLLYLYIEWSQGSKLVRDISEMLTPPVQPRILPRFIDKPYIP